MMPVVIYYEPADRWYVVPPHIVAAVVTNKGGRGQHQELAYESATLSIQDFDGDRWVVPDPERSLRAATLNAIRLGDEHVEIRQASEGSVVRIAEVTLPLRSTTKLPLTYNELQRTWSLISSDPNLKVLGPCTMPIPEASGTPVIGFAVSVPTSFMQVVELSGRYFLRDGYHRAYGLLSAGIRQVPAFVRSIESVEQLAPAGMLPQAAYLGRHPPLLVDYFDDQASTTVLIPAVNKQVIIHAVELDIAA